MSSPGLERPLRKPADFERFAGRLVRIKIREPRDGRRVYVGILESVQGDGVTIIVDGRPVSLPYDEISRARLALE